MEKQFRNINYLKQGNERQRSAYQVLKKLRLFDILSDYNPILVGTIPIGIDIFNSDLDVICEVFEHDIFEEIIMNYYGNYDDFQIEREIVRGMEASFSSFRSNGFGIEIFGQAKPVFNQNGYRHMIVEKKLLDLGGKEIKDEIRKLKQEGVKTEPAFARYLRLKGDPYEEMLKLSLLSKKELFKIVKNVDSVK